MKSFWSPNFIALLVSSVFLAVGAALKMSDMGQAANLAWVFGTIPALLILIRSIFRAIVRRELGIDLLALISIVGALAMGQFLTAIVIGVMLASGQALENYAQRRAGKEMSALLTRAPKFANRIEQSQYVRVPIDQIAPGDHLLVRSGEVVPVDGSILSLTAMLDESALTGEAALVERRSGANVSSGTINAGTPFDYVAKATSADSTYAGVVKLVEAAQQSKAPASRLADRYSLWFLPFSLGLAALAWLFTGDPIRGLAVLVVATPCPLILAVPIAIVAGMSSCAKRSILVKGGAALEKLGQARILFFDKTGTLTGGMARLIHIECGPEVNQTDLLRLAASLEQMSSHVIATAVAATARNRGIELSTPSDVQEQGGSGLTGTVEGKRVVLGSFSYVSSIASQPTWTKAFLERVADEGGTSVFVALDGSIVGALLLADQIRIETPRALRLLRKAGVTKIVMLTGDRMDVADAIGMSVGVDQVIAEQTPAGKQAAIEAARVDGVTIMVGDGINDAPALSVADVGVAMGARGAAASAEAADVVLLVDRLDRLAEALNAAQQVRRIAIQSVVTGMTLSCLAMIVAALGYLPPLYGAALQELIDVVVIINALRALSIKPLRVSQQSLSVAEMEKLKFEHENLGPILDRLTFLADGLTTMSSKDANEALINLDMLLHEKLIPHEKEDDRTTYPAVALLLGGDDPMAAMSRTHHEIFELGRRLKQSVKAWSDGEPTLDSIRNMQRLLYSLDAILRLHFAQEEEIYHSLG